MATNGAYLYWSRAFVDSLSKDDVCDVVLHEAGHIFLGHHLRQEKRDAFQWNVAADLALNDLLEPYYQPDGKIRRIGVFPGWHGCSEFYGWRQGQTSEFYYGELSKYWKKKQQQSNAGGQPRDGAPSQQGAPAPGQAGGGPPQQQGSGSGEQGDSEPEAYNPLAKPYDEAVRGQQVIGEILPAVLDDNPEAHAAAEREWEERVAQGISQAKAVGNVPGWVKEQSERMHGEAAGVNWKMLLRRFMTQHTHRGLDYKRPSRRHSWRKDIIMPSNRGLTAAPGAVLLDTSGSMHTDDLNRALVELEGILQAFQDSQVTLFQCDMRITDERLFRKADFPLRTPLEWVGRGGTDLGPAIKKIGEKHRNFKWLVIISDMEWNVGDAEDPGIATLWLPTTPEDRWYWGEPTFGQVIPYRAFHEV